MPNPADAPSPRLDHRPRLADLKPLGRDQPARDVLDLLRVVELLRAQRILELLLQEDFALGELALVDAVEFREA